MNKSRKPIGQLPAVHEISLEIPTYEERLRKARKEQRIARISEMKDQTLIWLGKGLRSIVNTLDVDQVPPSDNPHINKRAGKTAVAALLLSVGIIGAGVSYEASHTPKEHCEMITPEQLGDNLSPGQAATVIWEAHADLENTVAYEKSLDNFMSHGGTVVCDPYLGRLDLHN